MRFAAAAVLLSLAALAATAGPARACSCAGPIDPRGVLASADAAFVGTLVERRDPGDPDSFHPVTLVFRVDEALKGPLGPTVEVTTAASSASCGIGGEVGSQAGVVLRRQRGMWTAGLCDQLSPAALRAAARPLPVPDGAGPPAFLLGGRFGDVTTISLDRRLRTLAYGKGDGTVRAIAACPGARRVAEAASRAGGVTLRVREATGLRIVRRWRLSLPPTLQPGAVGCADGDGRRVFLFLTSYDRPALARVLTAAAGVRTVWRGTAQHASFVGSVAYLSAGRTGTALLRLHLGTGRAARIAALPPSTGPLVADAAGTSLAGVAQDTASASPTSSRLVVVEIGRRPASTRSVSLESSLGGDVAWLSDGRLLLLPHGRSKVRLFDRSLRPHPGFSGWPGGRAVIRGGALYGIDSAGRLVRASLPRGPVRAVRLLPGLAVNAVIALGP
jgi:hypothetical protein